MYLIFRKICWVFVIFGHFLGLGFLGVGGCGNLPSEGQFNENFLDIDPNPTEPTANLEENDTAQVVLVEHNLRTNGARIGSIADINPDHVLCLIIDPAEGDLADLQVCEADRLSHDTASADALCPESSANSSCSSHNDLSQPDYCEVTGASDYAFVVINDSLEDSTVAYQVVDVTSTPNKSCSDLKIDEESILADGSE